MPGKQMKDSNLAPRQPEEWEDKSVRVARATTGETRTERAVRLQLEASRSRRSAVEERWPEGLDRAYAMEKEALAILGPYEPEFLEPGCEVVKSRPEGLSDHQEHARHILLQGVDQIAEDASMRRTELLVQPGMNTLAMAIDTAVELEARHGHEKMLAHQAAAAHEAALRMLRRGLTMDPDRHGSHLEGCRCINTAVRLMDAFNAALLTLQRLRTGGNQTVTVQHVSIGQGGQAVIGNVSPRARKGRSKRGRGGGGQNAG